MTAKPLLPQQSVTMKGDAPSRDLVEVIQRIVDEIKTGDAALDTRLDAVEAELAASLITPATAVTLTTQTFVDFTGIPSWVNRITVVGRSLSTNGTSNVLLQVGDGAIVSTGYLGAVAQAQNAAAIVGVNSTAGCLITGAIGAASVFRFSCQIERVTGNNWVLSGTGSFSSSATAITFASEISLSGALDRVRLTTAGGVDQFDAGSVNISWE